MSNELLFKLGTIDVIAELYHFDGRPSLWLMQDINGGEYHVVLATLDRLSHDDLWGKPHEFFSNADGRHEFLRWAGMLSYVVNATPGEADKFLEGLVRLLQSVGTWTKVTSYDH